MLKLSSKTPAVEATPNSPTLVLYSFTTVCFYNPSISDFSRGLSWCVACGSVVKDECRQSQHPSISLNSTTVKNMDAFFSLKQEFCKVKEAQRQKLACNLEKRKQVAEELELYMDIFKRATSDLELQQEENSLQLNQLIALLEENSSATEKKDFFLTELTSLAEESSSAETLLAKMKESVEVCEEKLRSAELAAADYELCKKFKIKIHLYDQDDRLIPCHWLDGGFSSGYGRIKLKQRITIIKQNLYLLSHVIFSFLKNHKDAITDSASTDSSSEEAFDASSMLMTISPVTQQKFVLGQSIFVLWLMRFEQPIGAICIRPIPEFRPDFMQKLGDFCFQSPKYFPNKITKVILTFSLFLV